MVSLPSLSNVVVLIEPAPKPSCDAAARLLRLPLLNDVTLEEKSSVMAEAVPPAGV